MYPVKLICETQIWLPAAEYQRLQQQHLQQNQILFSTRTVPPWLRNTPLQNQVVYQPVPQMSVEPLRHTGTYTFNGNTQIDAEMTRNKPNIAQLAQDNIPELIYYNQGANSVRVNKTNDVISNIANVTPVFQPNTYSKSNIQNTANGQMLPTSELNISANIQKTINDSQSVQTQAPVCSDDYNRTPVHSGPQSTVSVRNVDTGGIMGIRGQIQQTVTSNDLQMLSKVQITPRHINYNGTQIINGPLYTVGQSNQRPIKQNINKYSQVRPVYSNVDLSQFNNTTTPSVINVTPPVVKSAYTSISNPLHKNEVTQKNIPKTTQTVKVAQIDDNGSDLNRKRKSESPNDKQINSNYVNGSDVDNKKIKTQNAAIVSDKVQNTLKQYRNDMQTLSEAFEYHPNKIKLTEDEEMEEKETKDICGTQLNDITIKEEQSQNMNKNLHKESNISKEVVKTEETISPKKFIILKDVKIMKNSIVYEDIKESISIGEDKSNEEIINVSSRRVHETKSSRNDNSKLDNTVKKETDVPRKKGRCHKRKEDSRTILTHVLDGFVIQESNMAFAIREPLKERTNVTEEKRRERRERTNVTAKNKEQDNPFANTKQADMESWTIDQLAEHLSKYDWQETMSILRTQEVDGEALLLASRRQLLEVGVCESHADIISLFTENSNHEI